MKFLYCTDLHGDEDRYVDILNHAIEHNKHWGERPFTRINLIVLGRDLLPKGSNITKLQKNFLNGFLKSYHEEAKDAGIRLIASFGNDDLYPLKKHFPGELFDAEVISGWNFLSYHYVPDYPFGLKDACKLDYAGWQRPRQEWVVPRDGYLKEIPNIDEYFKNKGTIKEDLDKIQLTGKDVFLVHCPPASYDLDVCMDGSRVGSIALRDWLEKRSPKLCCCGHIHESFRKTGVWRAKVGNSLVIQPGTEHFVEVDLNDDDPQVALHKF